MAYEYKVVGAPEKCGRHKGARTASDRVAAELAQVIKAEAVDGWEYYRVDILPILEKRSAFGRAVETHRAVVVFRRSLGSRPGGAASDGPALMAEPPSAGAPERKEQSPGLFRTGPRLGPATE